MNKVSTNNLGMIVTERCNLNCAHCLQGQCSSRVMSDEVIKATLEQFNHIMNISICGGEPTLDLGSVEKIFSYIIENKIIVDHVSTIINGTIYSDELLRLLDYIENYINYKKKKRTQTGFRVSYDIFHYDELKRLDIVDRYVENVKKYQESCYYVGLQTLGRKVLREGNAENLDSRITVPMTPPTAIMTYVGKHYKLDRENGLCYVGPFVTVNPDGLVTECDASNVHQIELYNYGNVLTDSIEDIYLRRDPIIVKPKKYIREVNRQLIKYDKSTR